MPALRCSCYAPREGATFRMAASAPRRATDTARSRRSGLCGSPSACATRYVIGPICSELAWGIPSSLAIHGYAFPSSARRRQRGSLEGLSSQLTCEPAVSADRRYPDSPPASTQNTPQAARSGLACHGRRHVEVGRAGHSGADGAQQHQGAAHVHSGGLVIAEQRGEGSWPLRRSPLRDDAFELAT